MSTGSVADSSILVGLVTLFPSIVKAHHNSDETDNCNWKNFDQQTHLLLISITMPAVASTSTKATIIRTPPKSQWFLRNVHFEGRKHRYKHRGVS